MMNMPPVRIPSYLLPSSKSLLSGLLERRERKRAKLAIIKPPEQPTGTEETESEDGSEDSQSLGIKRGSKKKERKKEKKTKVPAGLALMYGFSATNVGKNRLTV
jgi:hypothetical protein